MLFPGKVCVPAPPISVVLVVLLGCPGIVMVCVPEPPISVVLDIVVVFDVVVVGPPFT